MAQRILLITGPAGAGKTTVAEAWASSRESRCAHLSLDTFRLFVKSGYHDPRSGWNDEGQRQLDIARSNIASVARNFVESEIDCVIDDVVFPNWEPVGLEQWERALAPVGVTLVALMPRWAVIDDRNREREESDPLPPDMLRTIYDDMAGWSERSEVSVIDNSDLSIPETLAEIERILGN